MLSALRSLFLPARDEIPGLNGVRAAGTMIVIAGHVWHGMKDMSILPEAPWFVHAVFGNIASFLDLFFVLSGYLIAAGLRKAYAKLGRVDFRVFFISRSMRIFPAYYFFLAINFLLTFKFLLGGFGVSDQAGLDYVFFGLAAKFPHDAFYITNYTSEGSIVHGWSLAVEEHFYLILPFFAHFVMYPLQRYTRLMLLAGLYLGPLLARWYVLPFVESSHDHFVLVYYPTHCRADSLIAGIVLSELFPNRASGRPLLLSFGARLVLPVVALALLAAGHLTVFEPRAFFYNVLRYNCYNIGWALILVLAFDARTLVARLLGFSFWRPIARLSYSMYLWHFMASGLGMGILAGLYVPGANWVSFALLAAAAVAVTLIYALLSYVFVEFPFLQKRSAVLQKIRPAVDPGDDSRLTRIMFGYVYPLVPLVLVWFFYRALPDFGREAYAVGVFPAFALTGTFAVGMIGYGFWKRRRQVRSSS